MPKTIFGTTEKSNFILNMNKSTVRKWVTGLLCACVIVPLIGGIVITAVPGTSALLGAFLYATGFSCILFYIVLLLRKDISIKDYPCAYLVIALAALALASYYRVAISNSDYQEAVNTALLGENGRYEGLLALFAYFGIFLLASAVLRKSSVKIIFDILVGAGIVQGIVAVLQHIPGDFPSDFRKLPALLLLKDVHLSSGLSDSPIFYGSFLTLVTAVAAAGAMYEKNILRARIYGVSAVFFFLTGLFTSSVVPLIGIGTAYIVLIVIEFTAGKSGNRSESGTVFEEGVLKSPRKRLAVLLIGTAAVLGIVLAFQGLWLRDKAIAYTDCYYRLFITGGASPVNYDSLWKIGAERSFIIIKEHPILGIGPDLMAKYQISLEELVTDSIDRSYNEYLYTAASRGIPALAVYIALLAASFARLFKDVREFFSDREKWFRPALLAAVTAYSVQAFFSASAVTVAPFFWLLLGISWSKFTEDKA
ncbi:MAG: O-antigen ligase family protein [Oscillospiraceae bacterium]|nr:O-antigen ligase family protein [Oscillospiraceae bacterium]